jgi:hypothetical protein
MASGNPDPQQPNFSLTPETLIDGNTLLDYSTKVGAALYKDTTSKFSMQLYTPRLTDTFSSRKA